jgi:hypothetical protein
MRARRSNEELTPELYEENLRWLVQLALPEVRASSVVRDQVQIFVKSPGRAIDGCLHVTSIGRDTGWAGGPRSSQPTGSLAFGIHG